MRKLFNGENGTRIRVSFLGILLIAVTVTGGALKYIVDTQASVNAAQDVRIERKVEKEQYYHDSIKLTHQLDRIEDKIDDLNEKIP